MEDKILKIIYTLVLGVMLALFVGIGIRTFYEGPKYPEYNYTAPDTDNKSSETQKAYQKTMDDYQQAYKDYNRNISVMALAASVVFLSSSVLLGRRLNSVLANGLLLGGLFTMVYSLMRGAGAEDSKLTFVTMSVGLAIVIYLGYRKFASEPPAKKAMKKK